jgi:putative ABC transport system permease protein
MRVREFSVRTALGARRGRLVRQLFAESLLLAIGGGLLGILAAKWTLAMFAGSVGFLPFLQGELDLDLAVLGYALAVSLAAAVIFGMAPIFFTSRISPMKSLKTGGPAAAAGPSQHRLRHALIIGQLTIGLPLIICSGLALRHVQTLRSADSLGFNPDHLLTFSIELPQYRYASEEQRVNSYLEMLQNNKAAPGIEAAGAVSKIPIGSIARLSGKITIEGRGEPEKDFYGYHVASPGYFEAMGARLASGRFFAGQDRKNGPPVAVMNRRAAMLCVGRPSLGS